MLLCAGKYCDFLTILDELIMKGGLTLSFFERRATRQLFGLVSNEEKVTYVHYLVLREDCVCCCILWVLTSYPIVTVISWEQWHLRVVVNNTPRPVSDDSAAVIERQRIQVCDLLIILQAIFPFKVRASILTQSFLCRTRLKECFARF